MKALLLALNCSFLPEADELLSSLVYELPSEPFYSLHEIYDLIETAEINSSVEYFFPESVINEDIDLTCYESMEN